MSEHKGERKRSPLFLSAPGPKKKRGGLRPLLAGSPCQFTPLSNSVLRTAGHRMPYRNTST